MLVRDHEKPWDDDSEGIFISNESLPRGRLLDEDERNFHASLARRLASQALRRMGLSVELRVDVDIVISEFVGNTARHGDGLADLDVVRTTETGEVIYVVVANESDESILLQPGSATALGDDHEERGRGLGIVDHLTTNWGQYDVPTSTGKRRVISYAVFHAGIASPISADEAA